MDDHPQIRNLVRAFLEMNGDITVVADTDNGEEAVHLVSQFHPDVILVDLMMRPIDGLEVIRRVRALDLPYYVCILALTVYAQENFLEDAYRSGADGYLLKDKATEELLQAIDVVCSGGKYTSPIIPDILARQKGNDQKGLSES